MLSLAKILNEQNKVYFQNASAMTTVQLFTTLSQSAYSCTLINELLNRLTKEIITPDNLQEWTAQNLITIKQILSGDSPTILTARKNITKKISLLIQHYFTSCVLTETSLNLLKSLSKGELLNYSKSDQEELLWNMTLLHFASSNKENLNELCLELVSIYNYFLEIFDENSEKDESETDPKTQWHNAFRKSYWELTPPYYYTIKYSNPTLLQQHINSVLKNTLPDKSFQTVFINYFQVDVLINDKVCIRIDNPVATQNSRADLLPALEKLNISGGDNLENTGLPVKGEQLHNPSTSDIESTISQIENSFIDHMLNLYKFTVFHILSTGKISADNLSAIKSALGNKTTTE